MNNELLTRTLQTIGKRTFVNCFSAAALAQLTPGDIEKHDTKMLGNTKPRSLSTKASAINRIFREESQQDALRECCNCRGDEETEEKARQLLCKH